MLIYSIDENIFIVYNRYIKVFALYHKGVITMKRNCKLVALFLMVMFIGVLLFCPNTCSAKRWNHHPPQPPPKHQKHRKHRRPPPPPPPPSWSNYYGNNGGWTIIVIY